MVFVCLMLVCNCVPAEECTHPEEKQECVDWWAEGECTWTNNNDGTHTAVYTGVLEVYQCTDCGRKFPPVELEGEKRLIENHYFYLGGECDCGLTDDGSCAHEHAVQEKEVRPGAVYTYVDEQKHSVSYTAVYVYNCPDCGCGYDVQGEYKTIEEEHMRVSDTECAYCGVFAEKSEYTLTYTFENDPFGRNMYTKTAMSGAVVTLDIPVGEVAENEGNYARLKSWPEDVPPNAQPVQFDVSEPDEWGCQP